MYRLLSLPASPSRRLSRALAAGVMLVGSALSAACGNPLGPDFVRETTLFVAPQRVSCVGNGPQSCLSVREPSQTAWQFFYDGIAGFTFEPGFDYELRVRIYRVANPPADGSSLNYQLVQLVRKSPASS